MAWLSVGLPGGSVPHSMEGSFQLLASLVCVILMGEFPTLLSGAFSEQNRFSQNFRYGLLSLHSGQLGC